MIKRFLMFLILIFVTSTLIHSNSAKAQSPPQITPSLQPLVSNDQENNPLEYWDKVSNIFAKLFQIVAIGGGAIWAYYKFVKGRVYRPRLKLSVHANNLKSETQKLKTPTTAIDTPGVGVKQDLTCLICN